MNPYGIAETMKTLWDSGTGPTGQGNAFSLTLATVENIKDDQNLNRVKCLPIGAPKEEETDWCYVMSAMGGKDRGLFLFPQVGDLVVLGYLENDPHRPIVLGSFWNNETKAPRQVKDGKAEEYCLITPNNVELAVHDELDKQKLTVKMPSGVTVELDDESQTVTTQNAGGDTSLLMKMKDGQIELKAKSKLTITVGQGSITMDDKGNISIKGGGDVTLEGAGVTVKSSGSAAVRGADVAVDAKASLELKAMGTTTVKGMPIKLN